jgi:hypothetical protein
MFYNQDDNSQDHCLWQNVVTEGSDELTIIDAEIINLEQ